MESDRCPECGIDIVDVKQRKSIIPWVHRAEIGRVRAYWRTVWLVSFGFKRFCQEMSRPAQLSDARRFRWVTVVVAFLPFAIVALVTIATAGARGINPTNVNYNAALFSLLGVLAALAIIPAIPFYALRHRELDLELQHRAAVLLLYAGSANLAWMFVAALFAIGGLIVKAAAPYSLMDAVLGMIGFGLFCAIWFMTVRDVVRIIKLTIKTPKAVFLMSLKIGVLWIAGGLLALVGLPLTIVFFILIYYSLQ